MKKIIIYITFIFFVNLFYSLSFGQDIHALKVGDKVPDIVFKVLNSNNSETVKASELYSKGILILNFWTTNCKPCIEEMPRLEKLGNRFKDVFSIVFASKQTDNEINRFLKRFPKLNNLKFITNDPKLYKYFEYTAVPHNVWIDKSGTITAITDDHQVTEVNITKFLNGRTNMPIKNEEVNFNASKHLVPLNDEALFRSIILPYKNIGRSGEWPLHDFNGGVRFLGYNMLKVHMFWCAYMPSMVSPRDYKLIKVNTKDARSYFLGNTPDGKRDEKWIKEIGIDSFQNYEKKNLYCYELFVKNKIEPERFYRLMQQELCSFFNVKVHIEPRLTECWVISKLNNKILDHASATTERFSLGYGEFGFIAKGQTIDEIAESLTFSYQKDPHFVNDTGLNIRIDIDLKGGSDMEYTGISIKEIRKYLNEIGLDINKKNHLFPHLIIEEL